MIPVCAVTEKSNPSLDEDSQKLYHCSNPPSIQHFISCVSSTIRLSVARVIRILGKGWLLLGGGHVDILINVRDPAIIVFYLFQYDDWRPPFQLLHDGQQ